MPPVNIDRHHTALLVIDVQHGLFHKSIPIYRADELLANINLLVSRAHASGVPVIYFQHSGDPAMPEGTPGWQLHPALQPQADDTRLIKQQGNAFDGTALDQLCKSKNITTLLLTGLITHACVKATCLGALQLGYSVVLVQDGHSNYSKDAARLIDKWNQKLSEKGCALKPASEIEFP